MCLAGGVARRAKRRADAPDGFQHLLRQVFDAVAEHDPALLQEPGRSRAIAVPEIQQMQRCESGEQQPGAPAFEKAGQLAAHVYQGHGAVFFPEEQPVLPHDHGIKDDARLQHWHEGGARAGVQLLQPDRSLLAGLAAGGDRARHLAQKCGRQLINAVAQMPSRLVEEPGRQGTVRAFELDKQQRCERGTEERGVPARLDPRDRLAFVIVDADHAVGPPKIKPVLAQKQRVAKGTVSLVHS